MYYSLCTLFRYMNPSYPVNLSPTRMASTSAAISYIISQIASDDSQTSSKAVRQVSLAICYHGDLVCYHGNAYYYHGNVVCHHGNVLNFSLRWSRLW